MAYLVDNSAKSMLPVIQSRIMSPVDANNPPSEFKEGKFMVFIGGGNGSGKTVINNILFSELEKEGYNREYIAEFGSSIFDDLLSNRVLQSVRVKLEQYLHSAASPSDEELKPSFLKQVAFRAFTLARSKAMDVGAPVIIDYHMHDKDFVKDCIDDARKHGYECIFLTPHIDAEKIIPRIEKRHKKTGRPFKIDKILTRHRQFAENIEDYLHMFDLSVVLDNNKENAPPSIIAISHNGRTTIFNRDSYDKVKQKSGINTHATNTRDIWAKRPESSSKSNTQPEPRTVEEGNATNNAAGKGENNDKHFVRIIEDRLRHDLGNSDGLSLR